MSDTQLVAYVDGLVNFDGSQYYSVPAIDRMDPFLMSVVSDGDRWMFISSSGALTAGRRDAAGALFPYETDDRLHAAAGVTGPVTAIRVTSEYGEIWRPFRDLTSDGLHRALYKSVVGDRVIFEERNERLGLTFRYRWANSDRFGFVRTATLINDGEGHRDVHLVDGLVNILPFGLTPALYDGMSNLTNAYKRSEIAKGRLAIFSLEAAVVDQPEPAEVLRATVAWSSGLDGASLTVGSNTLRAFERNELTTPSSLTTGKPGAYLLENSLSLPAGSAASWHIVADSARDQVQVTELAAWLDSTTAPDGAINASLDATTRGLVDLMALADADQCTGDPIATAHHRSNTTYNVMRGGAPLNGYVIDRGAFSEFVAGRNRPLAHRMADWLASLPTTLNQSELIERIESTGDADLSSLGMEYLPFSFSRRHGDPSRPWNAFSIQVRDESGDPIVYYEGNWRDIFQNWEALAMSFPEYLPGMLAVFVNASTPDGFNPYRITSRGIDWEEPDPHDPWSNTGYWGDHQIVYLLRLLEAADRYLPGAVAGMLTDRRFAYADVPYRLRPYEDLVADPKSTIDYDQAAADRTSQRVAEIGADGKLMWNDDGEVTRVTLVEKLLVPALSKLANFIPGGGIWMNTQRPEWNDANNALVGYGVSMVTLYYLRRYLAHLRHVVDASLSGGIEMSSEVAELLGSVTTALTESPPGDDPTDAARKQLMDRLGSAFTDYRVQVYAEGFSGMTSVPVDAVRAMCDLAIEHLDATIRGARGDNGLYESYNLIHFSPDASEASVEHLYDMLEGQVALLSSGMLTAQEAAEVIEALFASEMYRADVGSFMLYPPRRLPSFLDKNLVPQEAVNRNPLLRSLLDSGERSVLTSDVAGNIRFNASFANRDDLARALDALSTDPAWADSVDEYRDATLAAYEEVFNHHAFTGRSGTMYGFEGIGSIYWHMVAKLLLAVQEAVLGAASAGTDIETINALVGAYWRIRSGLGFNRSAAEFGAIPLDPYSHTPGHAGAQQPGMTGLVKEELLTRSLELGIHVVDGEIRFDPILLTNEELQTGPCTWTLSRGEMGSRQIELKKSQLGMTLCQVPVVVGTTDGEPGIDVELAAGTTRHIPGLRLDSATSASVFARSGDVVAIRASIPRHLLGQRP